MCFIFKVNITDVEMKYFKFVIENMTVLLLWKLNIVMDNLIPWWFFFQNNLQISYRLNA